MKSTRVSIAKTALTLALGLSLASCKPVDEGDSAVKADAANKVVAGTVVQFNLAQYIATNGVGGANFKNNVKAGNAYLFFSSAEDAHPDATNAAELKKSAQKTKLMKPEYEIRTNMTVTSNSKLAEIKSLFWIDALLNGTRVYPTGNTVEVELLGKAKTALTLKAAFRIFGSDVVNQTVATTKPFSVTKTFSLEYKQTVLGIPKLAGVEVGVSLVAAAVLKGEADYVSKDAISMSLVPDVKITAGIQGAVKALLFASAEAKGTVTVLDTSFPSSASLGGRVNSGADYLYGNVTYDGALLTALQGQIAIAAKSSAPGILPKGVEAALWSQMKMVKGLKLKFTSGFEWTYVVWDSPSLVNVKFPNYYTHSFLVSDASKASCALPILTKEITGIKGEVAKDTGDLKTVGNSAVLGLNAILAKAKTTAKGTCSK